MSAPAKQPMSKRRTGANQLVFVGAVLIGLVALNIMGARFFGRWDLTEEKVYTLSEGSKKLVRDLPDRLTVKAFLSSDLQAPFSTTATYLRDLLDEYAAASNGKLVWEAIDPTGNKELEEEAKKHRVPKRSRGRADTGKLTIAESYLGVSFQYQGNIESVPELAAPEGMEYVISSMIKRLTTKKRKVAFAISEGELSATPPDQMGQGGGLQLVSQYLQDYEVVPVALHQGAKPLGDDIEALIVPGPKNPMSERAKFVIDQFLMRGKSVAFLVDGMELEQPRQAMPGMGETPRIAKKSDVGLDDLLAHYGVKLRDDLVLEPRQNAPGPVPVQGQLLLANYPTFPVAAKSSSKHSSTDFIKGLVMPFASTLEIDKDKQKDLVWTPLVTSTSDAWRQTGLFLFNPTGENLKVGTDKGPFVMAVAGEGKLTSFFAGKPYPNDKGEKVQPAAPNSSPAPGEEQVKDVSDGPARIVVVGSSHFASDDYVRFGQRLPIYGANVVFFMGIVDFVAKDDGLAPLRSKGMTARPLTMHSDATPVLVKLSNIAGVPLALIAFGLVRWRIRLARRKRASL